MSEIKRKRERERERERERVSETKRNETGKNETRVGAETKPVPYADVETRASELGAQK